MVSFLWQEDLTYMGDFSNNAEGITQLLALIESWVNEKGIDEVKVAMEPTGVYHLALFTAAYQAEYTLYLPNPVRVRDWAKGQGIRAKTDKQDSLLLAQFVQANPRGCHQTHPLSTELHQLEALLQRRDELAKMRRMETNRLHALELKEAEHIIHTHDLLLATITLFDQQLQQIEAHLTQLMTDYPYLQGQYRLLLTVPGIGLKTVWHLLFLLNKWSQMTGGEGTDKALTAYLGLDPKPHESGTSVKKPANISRMGNKQMRQRLYMAALGGKRAKESALTHFYNRLVGRGKPKKVALVASSRKILLWAWAVFRKNEPFDSSRFQDCLI